MSLEQRLRVDNREPKPSCISLSWPTGHRGDRCVGEPLSLGVAESMRDERRMDALTTSRWDDAAGEEHGASLEGLESTARQELPIALDESDCRARMSCDAL